MATIVNQRDVTLQAAPSRLISDNILYREDKANWVLRYSLILSEKTSIDNLADKYGLTSYKTTYDNAVTALTSYLATLTTPVAWNNYDNYTVLSTDSTGGAIFRSKFNDVDAAKFAIQNQEALFPPPTNGADGQRGSQTLYISGSVWSDAAADAATTGANVLGDTVTISNGSTFVSVKYWNGSAWVPPGVVIDGSLIVTGSVTAAKINTNGLTIRDNSGNVILGTGFALDWTKLVASGQTGTGSITNSSITLGSNGILSGAGGGAVTIGGLGYTGDLNATYGASIGGSLSGSFGASQVAAYFAANSISSTYIQDLAASKILAGTLAAGVVYAGTINANQINAGTLTGFTIQTAASGARVILNNSGDNTVSLYNTSGILTGQIGGNTGTLYINSFTSGETAATLTGGSGTNPSVYISSGGGINTTALKVYGKFKVTGVAPGGGTGFNAYSEMENIWPAGNNQFDLGTLSVAWRDIYTVNGETVTSDINKKTMIELSDLGIDFINKLEPVKYKWKEANSETKEPGKRWHYGLIAQQVREVLDTDNIGIWVSENRYDPKASQMLRYSELISPMIKAIQELSTKVQDLEAKLNT